MLIGGSYIGCEVAASLTMLGKHCTIVMQEERPLERGFGARRGALLPGAARSPRRDVHGGDELERFEGDGPRRARSSREAASSWPPTPS